MTTVQMHGIHELTLRAGVDTDDFEQVMTGHVLPEAANVPGGVNRGNQSAIRSQHLLERQDGSGYLWLVKGSGVFSPDGFARAFERMYTDHADAIDPFAERTSSVLVSVSAAYEVGPRDLRGPTEHAHVGTFI